MGDVIDAAWSHLMFFVKFRQFMVEPPAYAGQVSVGRSSPLQTSTIAFGRRPIGRPAGRQCRSLEYIRIAGGFGTSPTSPPTNTDLPKCPTAVRAIRTGLLHARRR
jgi:hypothetical protein